MARRKSKQAIESQAIGVIVCLALLWLLLRNLQTIGLLLGLGVCVIAAAIVAVAVHRNSSKREVLEKARQIVELQTENLARRRAQLVYRDPYGQERIEKWEKEKNDFINRQIVSMLRPNERKTFQQQRFAVMNLIEARARDITALQHTTSELSQNITGYEFETLCADQLRQVGWNARITPRGRDQGVDIVAEMNSIRVVLQCKCLSRPVGNKAVQEAVAARGHEAANFAAVVTNNDYTIAARELAATNGIWLLHFSELPRLWQIINK